MDDLFEHVMEFSPELLAVEGRSALQNAGEKTDGPAAGDAPSAGLALPGGGGVYLLTDERDRIVQLAAAADLRRALRHRLRPAGQEQGGANDEVGGSGEESRESDADAAKSPDVVETAKAGIEPSSVVSSEQTVPSRRADLSTIVRRIRWTSAYSVFELSLKYLHVARVLMPTDYAANLAFGPAWFVHVDPAAEVPRWVIRKYLDASGGVQIGPFATSADAGRFVAVLQDVFDLCRYEHILEKVPHGQACAYFEMGRCPAPCDGTVPMNQYRATVQAALDYALGTRGAVRAAWEGQMRRAAAELAFERAAMLKQRLDRASELEHAAFRWVRPVNRLRWLVVQRGSTPSRVRAFLMLAGQVEALEEVRLKEVDAAAERWGERLRATGGGADDEEVADGDRQTPRAHRETLNSHRRDAGATRVSEYDPTAMPAEWALRSEHLWLLSHFLFKKDPPGLYIAEGALPSAVELAARVREVFARGRGKTQEMGESVVEPSRSSERIGEAMP